MRRAEFYSMAVVHHPSTDESHMIISPPSAEQINQSSSGALDNHHLVCYYALHEATNGTTPLQPEDIDPFLCTHILIAFATVENCTLQPLQPGDIEVRQL